VTDPNGSGTVTVGVEHDITWTSSGTSGNVKIELSRDSGATYETLTASTTDDGTFAWTPTGIPSAICLIRITDAASGVITDTSDAVFTIAQASAGNLPSLTAAEITSDSSGRKLKLTFDKAVNYRAGHATVKATALIGQSAKRQIKTDGTTPAGDGTTILTFDLRRGKPVMSAESSITVDLPLGFVITASDSTYVNNASTGGTVANNSTRTYAPMGRIISKPLDDFSGTYTVEVDAGGMFGVASVQMSITDGSATLGPVTVTSRSQLASYRFVPALIYAYAFDISTLADGLCTMNVTTTCPVTGGTRANAITFYNNTGGTLATTTYFVKGTSGNDSTGDGSSGNPYKTIQKVILAAHGSTARTKIVLDEAGVYDANAGYAGFNLATGRALLVVAGAGLTTADVTVTGDANGIDFQSNIPVILSGVGIKVSKISDGENISQLVASMCVDCKLFNKPTLTNTGAGYSWAGGTGGVYWNCTFQSINTGPFNVGLMRSCLVDKTNGDFVTGLLGAVIDCKCTNRGYCRISGTVSSSAPNATIAKSGNVYTTVDNTNGTHNFDAGTASYDTVAELAAGIAALTGWTFGVTSGDGSLDTTLAVDFSAKSAAATLNYMIDGYGPHSDGFQNYADCENVIFSHVLVEPFDDRAVIGTSDNLQDLWLDHDPAHTVNGMLIYNWSSPHMRLNPTRSGINGNHNPISDLLIMYVSMPYSYLNLINNAGAGAQLIPDNIAIMYSAFRGMNPEALLTAGIEVDPDEFWLVGLNWNQQTGADTDGAQLLAANYDDVTVNLSDDEFASLDVDTLDLTPIDALLGRVPLATGFGDVAGHLRLPNSEIGAMQAPRITVTAANLDPDGVTLHAQFDLVDIDANLSEGTITGFTVAVSGASRSFDSIAVESSNTVQMVLSSSARRGQGIRLSISDTNLQDTLGNHVADVSDFLVTNGSGVPARARANIATKMLVLGIIG
jgi:hypothetical protein